MQAFDPTRLKSTMVEELTAIGLSEDSIFHVTESLIQTSLRGVDSHGINLFPHYHAAIIGGRITRAPKFSFEQRSSAAGVLDADGAIGHHSGAVAMQRAIELAGTHGMGAVAVKNSSHFGAAAYFGLMAPQHDCIGFAFTNADALVKATHAKERFFGTNPICFTAPLLNEEPLCLDMATSTISWNKRNNYLRNQQPLEAGWAFDRDGRVTTDPANTDSLAPTGGYKGYALGMMVEVLSSVLAGSLLGKDITPMFGTDMSKSRDVGHFVMALDIAAFSEPGQFKERLQNMVDRIRELEPADTDPVMVAGDPQKLFYRERIVKGIPVDHDKYLEFLAASPRFSSCLTNV